MVLLLDGIVGEMNLWLEIVNAELIGRSADVSLFVPVGSCGTVKISDEHVVTDIEFPVIVKEWPVYVHLYDEGLYAFRILRAFSFLQCFFHDVVKLIYLINHSYSVSSIAVLSRLDDPYIAIFREAIFLS